MIFVKWKEGLWCRARVVEVLQNGCVEAVKACPVDLLASILVFFLDYGLTKSISMQRYTHKWIEGICISLSQKLKKEPRSQSRNRSHFVVTFNMAKEAERAD